MEEFPFSNSAWCRSPLCVPSPQLAVLSLSPSLPKDGIWGKWLSWHKVTSTKLSSFASHFPYHKCIWMNYRNDKWKFPEFSEPSGPTHFHDWKLPCICMVAIITPFFCTWYHHHKVIYFSSSFRQEVFMIRLWMEIILKLKFLMGLRLKPFSRPSAAHTGKPHAWEVGLTVSTVGLPCLLCSFWNDAVWTRLHHSSRNWILDPLSDFQQAFSPHLWTASLNFGSMWISDHNPWVLVSPSILGVCHSYAS